MKRVDFSVTSQGVSQTKIRDATKRRHDTRLRVRQLSSNHLRPQYRGNRRPECQQEATPQR